MKNVIIKIKQETYENILLSLTLMLSIICIFLITDKYVKNDEKSLEHIFCEFYFLDENNKRSTSFVFIHEKEDKTTIEKTCDEIIQEWYNS